MASSNSIPDMSDAEWQTRVDLAACYRLLAHFGMTDLVANHISAKIPGTEEFLLNPYGWLYEEITASSLIKLDIGGNILQNPHSDYSINRAGYVVHSAVHQARKDVGCVIHTHTPAGVAVSTMSCGILPLTQSAMRFSEIGYHDFEGVAVNEAEKVSLVRDLGQADVMVLRNHGLLACGSTVAQAFNNIYRIERVCQIQLLAMSANTELIQPDADVIQLANRHYASGTGAVARKPSPLGELAWPAMLRLLSMKSPGYDQ
ncbi:MAG: class II aldolase/adducin family protein [Sphingobacterium sp.]